MIPLDRATAITHVVLPGTAVADDIYFIAHNETSGFLNEQYYVMRLVVKL